MSDAGKSPDDIAEQDIPEVVELVVGEVFEISGSAPYCATHPNHSQAVVLGALRAAAELVLLRDDHSVDQEERETDFGILAAEIYQLACSEYAERRAEEAGDVERWLRAKPEGTDP